MVEHRPELDKRMSEEGARALHQEFILAEGGILPDAATRMERARAASAKAWMRHLASAIEAGWPSAPAGLADQVCGWLVRGEERLEALQLDEEARSEQRGRAADPNDDRREVELRALGRLFAESIGSICRPGDEGAPVFAKRVGEWQLDHLLRGRELVEETMARTTPDGLSGAEQATELWERVPADARARAAALLWARVQFLTYAVAASLEAAGPAQPDDAPPTA